MFAYRITLFELMGFKVRIDISWIVLAMLVVWSLAAGYFPEVAPDYHPLTYWWMALGGLLGLAFSIVIHEFAHSLVARRYGMPIKGITLFIFGGVAEMHDEPENAKGEFLMAIAGPAMSIAVAVVFYGAATALDATGAAWLDPTRIVLAYLAFLNAILAVFNMIPAFPLDGGRVLRSALWAWRGDITWATRIASNFGAGFGYLLMAAGLYSLFVGAFLAGIWWLLIGFFVRAAASGTYRQQMERNLLQNAPVSRFMRETPKTVAPAMTLDRLVDEIFLQHYLKQAPVVDTDGKLQGCVTVTQVRGVRREEWPLLAVRSVMDACDPSLLVEADEDASQALTHMRQSSQERLLVVENGVLVGEVRARDLADFLAVKSDLGETQLRARRTRTKPQERASS